ncbi:rRNA maturation RNase YbeY [Sulfitobacter sp. JB4-11]|uniref:rRNA maturation RNase YbeY n=1 Tax=Sulfitobacter rhodophyticola TaxID=3238304 RepID=UPI003516DDF8
MMLEVVVEDDRWNTLGIEPLATRAMQVALAHLDVDAAQAEVTMLACDDARIATLNADFRGKPTATNVLSWPAKERGATTPGGAPQPPNPDPDGTIPLGDLALAYQTCAREAEDAGIPMTQHTTHLIVHGLLHLLGYDHETDADAALMEGLEVEILGKMGLDDPYRTSRAH